MGKQTFVEKLEDRLYYCGNEFLEYIDSILYVYDTEFLESDMVNVNGELVTQKFFITSCNEVLLANHVYSSLHEEKHACLFTKFDFEENASTRLHAFVGAFYAELNLDLDEEPQSIDYWMNEVFRWMRKVKLDIALNYSDELRNAIIAEMEVNDYVQEHVIL